MARLKHPLLSILRFEDLSQADMTQQVRPQPGLTANANINRKFLTRKLASPALLSKVVLLLNQHFAEQENLPAPQCHLSPKYLSDCLKHLTDQTAQQLIQANLTVSEIPQSFDLLVYTLFFDKDICLIIYIMLNWILRQSDKLLNFPLPTHLIHKKRPDAGRAFFNYYK